MSSINSSNGTLQNLNHLRLNGDTSIQFDKNTKYHIYTKEPQQKKTHLHCTSETPYNPYTSVFSGMRIRFVVHHVAPRVQHNHDSQNRLFFTPAPTPQLFGRDNAHETVCTSGKEFAQVSSDASPWLNHPAKRMNSSSLGSSPLGFTEMHMLDTKTSIYCLLMVLAMGCFLSHEWTFKQRSKPTLTSNLMEVINACCYMTHDSQDFSTYCLYIELRIFRGPVPLSVSTRSSMFPMSFLFWNTYL